MVNPTRESSDFSSSLVDQNKDGEINRKDMIKIIEAMYDLANEEDRSGDKSPDKRVDLIMQRLHKEKDGQYPSLSLFAFILLVF